MKKTLLIMVMALAVLLTQCRKPEVKFPSPVAPEGTTVSMTVTAGPGSKTDITAEGAITWSSGDKLYVGFGGEYVGYLTLTSGVGTPTGWFSGNVTLPNGTTGENEFGFFYLGSDNGVAPTVGATSVDVLFNEQNIYNNGGKLENAKKFHIGYGTAQGTVAGSEVTGINVTLVSKVALARFSFTKGSTDYTEALTLSGTNIYKEMTVNFAGTFTGKTNGNITLTAGHGERYVMLVPTGDATEQTLTFTGSAESGTGAVPGLESNKFYGKTGAIAVSLAAPTPAHETVNFGTPNLNWSVCNLGATNGATADSWYGDYYAWGETAPYYKNGAWCAHPSHDASITFDANVGYGWKNYTDGSSTSWEPDSEWDPEPYGSNKILKSAYDAATQEWGSDWRMPTSAEWQDLYDYNTFKWLAADATDIETGFTAVAAGYLVVKGGKKGASLNTAIYMFLPAAGFRSGTRLDDAGSYGYYWSATRGTNFSAYCMNFFKTSVSPQYQSLSRFVGCAVRPVR